MIGTVIYARRDKREGYMQHRRQQRRLCLAWLAEKCGRLERSCLFILAWCIGVFICALRLKILWT